jgi:exonuclease SbcC
MKFHRLTIRNLTTITGEQIVDFDALFSEGSPLLIHGPTGAGKTTILDAITLALYDETARISEADQAKKKQLELNDLKLNDPRQIISRGASSGSTELIFSTLSRGTRRYFRAGWHVERTAVRKGSTPKWGDSRRLLVELNPDFTVKAGGLKVESTKEKELKAPFEEALGGLTSQQFRRSVLLAQGQFAALLTADAEERADMLEGLTGTQEFSRIGMRASEQYGAAKTEVERIKTEMIGAAPWSDEAVAENRRQQELHKGEAARLEAEEIVGTAGMTWWKELALRELAVGTAEASKGLAETGHRALQPLRDWSARYAATVALIPHHEAVQLGAAEATQKQGEAQQLEAKIALLRQRSEASSTAQAAATATVESARAANDKVLAELPEVQAVHAAGAAASQALEVAQKQHAAASATAKVAAEKVAQAEAAERLQHSKVTAALTASQSFEAWRNREADVASLEGATAAFKAVVAGLPLVTQRQQSLELVKQVAQAEQSLVKEQGAADALAQEHEAAALQVGAAEERHRAASQAVADGDLQLGLLEKLASIEQHRHLLRPGEACALCGATEHPFASAPVSDRVLEIEAAAQECALRVSARTERQAELSSAQATLHRVAGALSQRRDQVTEAERKLSAASSALATRAAELGLTAAGLPEALKAELEAYMTSRSAAEQELVAACAWLPLPGLRSAELDADARLKAVQEQLHKATTAAAEVENQQALLAIAANAVAEGREAASGLTAAVATAAAEVTAAAAALASAQREVASRWSGRLPGLVVNEAAAALANAEAQLKKAAETLSGLQLDLTRETTLHRQLLDAAGEATGRAETARALRDNGLLAAGRHLDVFVADLRTPTELSEATQRLATADEKLRAAGATLEQATAAVATQRATPVPGAFDSATAASDEVTRLQSLLRTARDAAAELIGALGVAEQNRALQAHRQVALAKAEALCGQWKLIYDLIGVGNGAAFHKAAQALNLERVIRAANIWLAQLDGRYAFRQSFHADGTHSLDFHLIDAFHADAPRGINLISGGESFLCSLALALGLASERGETLSIETLLLDEGFGTLDSASLETAVKTLEKLKQRDTSVGIISHVEALRGRIETQLEVRPITPGRSEIVATHCP